MFYFDDYSALFKQNFKRADPERRKVLQIHSTLKNAGDSIARSTQIAIETDQIGNSVLNELNEQGEKLRNTNEMVNEVLIYFHLLIWFYSPSFFNSSLTKQMLILQKVGVFSIHFQEGKER